MKVLFAHDHTFYKYKENYYSTGGLSNEMLQRYLIQFDELKIVSRQNELNEKIDDKLTKASGENISFVKIENFKKIKKIYLRNKELKKIESEVVNSDYVIARIPSSIGEAAIKYARVHNKPYLIELVACTWDSLWNHSIVGKIVAPFSYFKLKKIVNDAPYCVYVTSKFLQKRYPNQKKSINCSNVNLKNLPLLKRDITVVKKKIIIGTTAAVNVKYKGQKFIIEALGELKKKGIHNIEYQLVGNGEQTYLKKIAKKNNVEDQVVFLGGLKHQDVLNWLDTLAIYIQPSLQEGLPRALIEAMSRGIPCLGTDRAGIPELISSSALIKVNSETSHSFADSIYKLINNVDLQSQYSQENYNESKNYYHEKIENRRQEFFKEFIKNS
ncbi:glycosyltransferase [Exiguobacterium sp. Leaf196]|uniref:glycosyltransferase n=1 Tax=Exiguobacterium sp. Leaf196 TaxID=1736298 RepID=UPI0006F9AF96|nr:glycosyltransferase [Exiguobacterium sp. Leaf196]KQS37482.1 glycosyl transferase [Exiguobacterium sp. Leaf196]